MASGGSAMFRALSLSWAWFMVADLGERVEITKAAILGRPDR
jgi:hypothetical protein